MGSGAGVTVCGAESCSASELQAVSVLAAKNVTTVATVARLKSLGMRHMLIGRVNSYSFLQDHQHPIVGWRFATYRWSEQVLRIMLHMCQRTNLICQHFGTKLTSDSASGGPPTQQDCMSSLLCLK